MNPTGSPRKKLSDILNGDRSTLESTWASTKAADDFAILPAGEYIAHLHDVVFSRSRTNATPGVKLTFKIIEGEYAGRLIWSDLWLTAPALPMTKRDLAKLGIVSLEQLDAPIPKDVIRCRCKVVIRKDDDATQRNRLRQFEVVGVDKPAEDAFAPQEGGAA